MEDNKKYDIKKTSKNSLEDILDIRKKNVKTDYWEETETKKTIKIYHEEMNAIISELYTELAIYMNKVLVKFNYSPIIDKIFPTIKKENDYKIEKLNHMWRYYIVELNRVMHKTKTDTLAQQTIYTFASFINKYLIHIFSIPKISECLNSINKKSTFKIYNFKDEIKDEKDKEIYLNIEKELNGNGGTFIFLKELKRLYDNLIFSLNCFKNTITYFFYGIDNLIENIYYKYVIENEVVSSLLHQIKLIFELYSNNKEVLDFINKYTVEMKNEIDKKEDFNKKLDDIYNHPEFTERFPEFEKEYEAVDKYGIDKIPEKAKFIFKEIKDLEKDYKLNGDEIEYEEDEKIKEINDLDELTKYIQGDDDKKKKKKKKKKRKDNPINKLSQFNISNQNIDDDQVSIVSHDTIFSNFKKDIINDNIEDNKVDKIQPVLSEKFIEDLK